MEFLMIYIPLCIIFVALIFCIPKIIKNNKKNKELQLYQKFLMQNEIYTLETAVYKNIVEVDFDVDTKKLGLYSYYENTSLILEFSEILDFEVLSNDKSIISSKTGSTIVGGLLFGSLGALAGASGSRNIDEYITDLKLKIYTTDASDSVVYLDFLDNNIHSQSYKYEEISKVIDKIINYLKIILERNKAEKVKKSTKENIDNKKVNNNINDLKSLAELKEKGFLTDEEFEESKKKLLGKL